MKRSVLSLILGSTLALAACGGGGSGGSMAVSGVVVDDAGTPISGAGVLLNGNASTLLTTGSDGTFRFAGVTPPYALTVRAGNELIELHGLTQAAPVVNPGAESVAYGTNLSGTLTGPMFPLPPNDVILVGGTNDLLSLTSATGSSAFGPDEFMWVGAPAKTADLVGMQVTITNHRVTGYGSWGKRTGVTLQSGTDQVGLDIALSTPVVTAPTLLVFDPGAYATKAQATCLSVRAGGANLTVGLLLLGTTIPSGTSLPLPEEGAVLAAGGEDSAGNSATRFEPAVLNGTTTLDLPSTTALATALPGKGSSNVGKTPTLTWTPVDGAGAYKVELTSAPVRYKFILPPGTSTFTVPDYSALGLPLEGNTQYTWSVLGIVAADLSPDSFADPVGAVGVTNPLLLSRRTTMFRSAASTFTTAP